MKSLFVLFLSVFTFGVAPSVPGLRSYPTVASKAPAKKNIDIEFVELPKDKPPALVKPDLAAGERWVPLLKLKDEVSEDSTTLLMSQIKDANEQNADAIVLEIDSPGGSVPDGFNLAKTIENSAIPVTCVIDQMAASMASFIFQSCSERLLTKRSLEMLHEPSVGGLISGQPQKFKNISEMLKTMASAMAEQYASKSKVTAAFILSKIDKGQEYWLGYKECLKTGLADHAVKSVDAVVKSLKKTGNSKAAISE